MNISDIPPVFRETLAVHAIFSAAGIPMADVYVLPQCIDPQTGREELGVQAQRGDRTFTVTVGPLGMPIEEFSARWSEAVRAVRQMGSEEHRRWIDSTQARSQAVTILAAVAQKLGLQRH